MTQQNTSTAKLTGMFATLAKSPAQAQAPQEQQTQSSEAQLSGETVLKGDFSGYVSFLTPLGKPYFFFEGYLATSDQEVVDAALKIPGVARTNETRFPRPPDRSRGRKQQASWSAFENPTVISPQELMQRAVAGSNTVPQSAESTSVTGQ